MAVNILVADDSVTMRRILELTFQAEDANVTAVETGESALRKASEITPDIVLADLSMPGMDGYALATAIKAAPGLDRTAVVVMASQKSPYDEDKGKAAGVDDHIIKPFDTQQLIDRVKSVLGKPRVAPGAARAAAPAIPAAPAAAARVGSKTIAFGKPPVAANTSGPAIPASPQARPQVAAAAPAYAAPSMGMPAGGKPAGAAAAAAAVAPPVASAVAAANVDLERKLDGLGLTAEQVAAVVALSREVVERVVWEVVPDLAETLIREEIRRLTSG